MRTLIAALVLIALPAFAQNPLRDAAAQGAASIAWKIATDDVYVCCCNDGNNIINHGDPRAGRDEILLVARMENGRIDKLRMRDTTCPLTNTRLVENVTPDASLDFLLAHLGDDDGIVAGIGMHDHPRAITELSRLAHKHPRTQVRRDAIFWLGQRAGEKAAGELRQAVDEDPEDEVREHAVFAISQLPTERAVPMLIDLVKNHKRAAVRKRAMFWLTQSGDPRALALIEEILGVR
jgi:hypothetical protein